MTDERKEFKAGDRVRLTLSREDQNEPIYTADYEFESPKKAKLLGERWRDAETRAFNLAPTGELVRGAKEGLEVAKFAWDFIKDNKPVTAAAGASTSVLAAGTTGLDYTNAKSSQTPTFEIKVNDTLIPSINYITAKFRLEGTYGATPRDKKIPQGQYLPSIYLNVTQCWAVWPTYISASAEVTPPSDVGTKDNVRAQTRLYAKFNFGWIGSSNNASCGFIADGANGMLAMGWQ